MAARVQTMIQQLTGDRGWSCNVDFIVSPWDDSLRGADRTGLEEHHKRTSLYSG